jgi:Rv0078B-related antitoxin
MATSVAARRIRAVFEMYEFGEQMYRAKLRREDPAATEDVIEARVRAWRLSRPAAPEGDAVGLPSRRFG